MHRACTEFFGIEYNPKGWDCVDLTLAVQRKLFGRGFSVPEDRTQARRQQLNLFRQNLVHTSNPTTGDVALMRDTGRSRADHIGTVFIIGGELCILHTTERTDTLFTRARLLSDLGITLEDYYTWRS
ncbi:hypothetical protein RCIP0075_00014 [Klebsiella phage RCIP0075]